MKNIRPKLIVICQRKLTDNESALIIHVDNDDNAFFVKYNKDTEIRFVKIPSKEN